MAVHDVIEHLRTMERAIVAALAQEGIHAHGRVDDGPDYTGVWVGERKIASLGVHVSRGISTHGFAVNVSNDLEPFSWVVACGLPDVQMTSLAAEAGAEARGWPAFESAWHTASVRRTHAASAWSRHDVWASTLICSPSGPCGCRTD